MQRKSITQPTYSNVIENQRDPVLKFEPKNLSPIETNVSMNLLKTFLIESSPNGIF